MTSKSMFIPFSYSTKLSPIETAIAIQQVKEHFQKGLSENLNLLKVSAPLMVKEKTGLNDNLNGVERTVSFDAQGIKGEKLEIVQSLAKWKRTALAKYEFPVGTGLYTDMNAIRRDEELDNLHSIYVDQWDWEKVISVRQRTVHKLKEEVIKIYSAMKATENHIQEIYPNLERLLPREIHFITTQELELKYPTLTAKEREDAIAKQYGAVFIMQIGDKLLSGEKHDGRSPDYDDWKLNGDIVVWYPTLYRSLELSSMGIRVDAEALLRQLKATNCEDRLKLDYHQSIIQGKLPYTIGGGIGQSRLCMFLLQKAHIGEVQVSVWNDEIIQECEKRNITLL